VEKGRPVWIARESDVSWTLPSPSTVTIDTSGGQPQQPPPQQPPVDAPGATLAVDRPPTATATVDNSFTVSSCPDGHATGSFAAWIDRLISNVSPQWRQRYS
jgi:hypothetical protein